MNPQDIDVNSATSSPILLRYLKQSTTVFAGLYTLTETPSICFSSMPSVRALPENRTNRMAGRVTSGSRAFRSIAIHTSKGACVVSP